MWPAAHRDARNAPLLLDVPPTGAPAPSPRRAAPAWLGCAALALAVSAVALVASGAAPRATSALAHDRRQGELLGAQPTPGACILVQTARGTADRLSERPCGAWVRAEDHVAAQPSGARRALDKEATIDLTGAAPVAHEILGFGGAFTESAALVFQALPPAAQQNFLAAYFGGPPAAGAAGADGAAGAPGGIGYSLGRVHINSCDFSVASYSFADVPEDFALAHFDDTLAHDARTMLPLIHAAQRAIADARGAPLRLLASPWSPPAWMKTSRQMDGSTAPLGLRAECRAVWAAYISRWLARYAAAGAPIWAVTMQNEPENMAAWEACMFTAEAGAAWVREHLGPTIRREHGDAVKILAYDHNKDHMREWANASFADAATARHFDGLAFHWYSGDAFDNVAAVRAAWPDKLLLATEATYEKYRWTPGTTLRAGEWAFGEGYAHDILGDLKAGAQGWIDWNLLLDERGGPNHLGNDCDAALMANVSSGELHVHPQYWYVGHFSKYLPPGSRLLAASVRAPPTGLPRPRGRPYGTCGAADGFEAGAFLRPDGRVATVVLNCAGAAQRYVLKSGGLVLPLEIPAHAIQTIVHARELGADADEAAPAGGAAAEQPRS